MDALKLALIVALWAGAAYRWFAVRRTGGDRGTLSLATALTLIAASLTINNPPVFVAAARLVGSTSVHAAQHILALAAGLAAVAFTAYATIGMSVRRWVRWGILASAAAGTAMVATAAIADAAAKPGLEQRLMSPEYAAVPGVVSYLVIYTIVLGVLLGTVAVLCARFGRHAARPALRWGMGLMVIGCAAGVLYSLQRLYQVLTGDLSTEKFSYVLVLTTIAGIALGVLVPAMGAGVDNLRRRRHLRALSPLRAALAGDPADVGRPTNGRTSLQYRLTSCVVDIRDALVLLGPWLPETDLDSPRAKAEAILQAQAARAAGQPRGAQVPAFGGGDTFGTDVIWLVKVAGHYQELTA